MRLPYWAGKEQGDTMTDSFVTDAIVEKALVAAANVKGAPDA